MSATILKNKIEVLKQRLSVKIIDEEGDVVQVKAPTLAWITSSDVDLLHTGEGFMVGSFEGYAVLIEF